jgi:hypothetical protein
MAHHPVPANGTRDQHLDRLEHATTHDELAEAHNALVIYLGAGDHLVPYEHYQVLRTVCKHQDPELLATLRGLDLFQDLNPTLLLARMLENEPPEVINWMVNQQLVSSPRYLYELGCVQVKEVLTRPALLRFDPRTMAQIKEMVEPSDEDFRMMCTKLLKQFRLLTEQELDERFGSYLRLCEGGGPGFLSGLLNQYGRYWDDLDAQEPWALRFQGLANQSSE